MKYQVILIYNEERDKSYYSSYVISDDATMGNLECTDLPPYQDINKARSCYWNGAAWIYDEVRYAEILAEIEAKKEAAQAEADRIAAIPSNEELNEMMLTSMSAIAEITSYIDSTVEPLTTLAGMLKGGEE